MSKKINAYQQINNQGKANGNLILSILTKIKSSLQYSTENYNPDEIGARTNRIKSLAKSASLISHVIYNLNYNENKELAELFRDFLIVLEDKINLEIANSQSQDFTKDIENLNHFIEISKI